MASSTKKFDLGSFLLGILFIFASLIAFADPSSNLVAVATTLGFMAIVKGFLEIFMRNNISVYTGNKSTGLLVLGIIDILVGVYLLFNLQATVLALPYVFAIWFIVDAILMLINADYAKLISQEYYYFTILMNILKIFLGVALLFNPLASALTISFLVGFYFMLAGMLYITNAFATNKML